MGLVKYPDLFKVSTRSEAGCFRPSFIYDHRETVIWNLICNNLRSPLGLCGRCTRDNVEVV